MDAFFELSWRAWPASAISLLGLFVISRGAVRLVASHRAPATDMARPIALASGLRFMLLGVSLAALGFAWTFQVVWIFWLAVIFGAEETWETSMVVSGLRTGERLKAARARATGSPARSG